jgi:hypothetical protein
MAAGAVNADAARSDTNGPGAALSYGGPVRQKNVRANERGARSGQGYPVAKGATPVVGGGQ